MPTQSSVPSCIVCDQPASMRCSKCKAVDYCGREHQLSDWKQHKAICGSIKSGTDKIEESSNAATATSTTLPQKPTITTTPVSLPTKTHQCAYCYARGTGFKACGACHHRFYCSKDHQILDWSTSHQHWCGKSGELDVDYEVRDVPGKGKGLFVIRDFKRNEKILVERPIIAVENCESLDPRIRIPNKEPDSVRDAIRALAPGNTDLFTTFSTNCVAMHDQNMQADGDETGMFIRFSRINHSCVPNCQHPYIKEHGVILVIASQDIKAGTEITHSYTTICDSAARRAKIWKSWGFKCDCEACHDKVLQAKLDRVNRLDETIQQYSLVGNVKEVLKGGHELIKLYEELGCYNHMPMNTYLDMFASAISKKEYYGEALKFIELSHKMNVAYYGCECEFTRASGSIAKNPRSHPNYGMWDDKD